LFDGIQNSENQNSVLLYPNPAHQFVEIHFKQEIPEKSKVRFLNLYGQIVMETEITEQLNLIHIDHLSSGIYILQIENKNTILNLKLLKE